MSEGSPWRRPRPVFHPTLLVLGVVAVAAGRGLDLGLVFGSVLLHELGHVAVGELCGLRATRITLYPFGGVADVPGLGGAPPLARLATLAAGPLVNLLLLLALVVWESRGGGGAGGWAQTLRQANLGILAANLLPVGPLDGGRMLELLMERRVGMAAARRRLLRAGVAAGLGLSAAGGVALGTGRPGGSLLLFGLFLAAASGAEGASASLAAVGWCAKGPRAAPVGPARLLAAPVEARVRDLAACLGPGPYRLVAVIGRDGRLWGFIDEGTICAALLRGAGEAPLETLLVWEGRGCEGPEARSRGTERGAEPSGRVGGTEEPL